LLLKSDEESKRVYALQRIKNYIRNLMAQDPSVSCLVVADAEYDLCIDAGVATVGYWNTEYLREYAKDSIHKSDNPRTWTFVDLNGSVYLCKQFVYDGRVVAAFTSTAELLKMALAVGDDGQTFVLTDTDGMIVGFSGKEMDAVQLGVNVEDAFGNFASVVGYEIAPQQIYLYNHVHSVVIWNQTRIGMLVSLAVTLVTFIFGVVLVGYLRREILVPTKRMTEVISRIDQGEHELRLLDEVGTIEFSQLQSSFNRLMDEIMNLKIQGYEKLIEMQDMELRSIRLQIHPHFFLNAISTISSLSMQGKDAEIKTYVDALSKNIRYMFKSGLHTVPVREEIRHVENYFEMQECKYPNCIFHFIELPIELEHWPVPQMVIQTFIENEYKYAVSVDAMLTILIRISLREYKGEEMLLIRIEDDGKGYPQDVLHYMSGEETRPANDGSRVGLWGVKRMMTLMYERDDLLELSNIKPHGCMNRIWIPKEPVHEMTDSLQPEHFTPLQQTKGDKHENLDR
ncbi:MAG: histidine kinase, partial [Clostridiales bacterium]|nr:histidine kinase [Clostridiales bacterium]